MENKKIGFVITGSFCTFEKILPIVESLAQKNEVIPVLSYHAATLDTRFFQIDAFCNRLEKITGHKVIDSVQSAEPLGTKNTCDIMVVAPCTGNTVAKLASGISDTPATLAVKAHLRGSRPLVIGISSNDALSQNAVNIGTLLNRKNYFFVPFGQDDYLNKAFSLVADFSLLPQTLDLALQGKQIQPILIRHE